MRKEKGQGWRQVNDGGFQRNRAGREKKGVKSSSGGKRKRESE